MKITWQSGCKSKHDRTHNSGLMATLSTTVPALGSVNDPSVPVAKKRWQVRRLTITNVRRQLKKIQHFLLL